MKFSEVVAQTLAWLQREGRVSYRALKREFDLDDEFLEDVKTEIIEAKRLATDEDGKVLVWTGASPVSSSTFQVSSSTPPPTSSTQSPDAARPTLHAPRAEAERRQLTVLFCDLVDSTKLSALLDPEEYRAVVRAYQATCTDVIRRYAGHTAQHLGDGILVYFGYPAAHEDDAQRAVRTALGIVEAIQKLSFPTIQLPCPLQVRIGIHTGLVVIGEIGSSEKREVLAMGETPNIAARLQGLAEPDTVVISGATSRLVQGLFECQDCGSQELKGISTPLPLYRVVRESAAQSRFEVAISAGLTPLVGREHEVELLQERWERAKQREGQVILLSGEAGIGKSRLVQTLKEQVTAEGATRIEFRCSPYHQNSAFYPVIEHLQKVLRFTRDDSVEQKLDKLEQGLSRSCLDLQETVPLLAALLSLPATRYTLPAFSPQKQKQKTQEALVAWVIEEAEHAPVYCAWEDLHWADPSTLEVLSLLLDQVPTTRLLAVLTFRPDFTPPWRSHSHITQLTLSRLGRPHVEAMVEKVTRGKTLPSEVLQQIVAKTDGVPLFVEELTKMVLESGLVREEDGRYVGAHGSAPIPPLAIPATLQDSLMARLDRLAPVKEIAQLGATLGREFSYELIHAISRVDEGTLQHGLRQLVDAELIYQRGLPPQATYLFKHALIQDTAYQSLLKSTRRQYHHKIAQVLADRFPEMVETQPELLAHHYTEAGLKELAIPSWQQAGQRAIERSANVEAISHLTKGLELLETLPDTPERARQELALQLALSNSLMATRGYAAPEVEQAYTRALELCQQVGETSQLFPVLVGLWRFYLTRAEYKTARELGEQCLSLAQHMHNTVRLLGAHQSLGVTLFYLGEFAQSRAHLEQAIALYDPQKRQFHASRSGQDPGVACLSHAAWTMWALGYPDQALKRSQEALALAQELSHPLSLAQALIAALRLHQYSREEQATQGRAEALITLSTEQGFAFTLAWGTMMRGWAVAEQGQWEEGIAQMRQGLAAHRATGAEANRPYYLACLAEAHGKVGQTEEGLAMLAEALAVVDKTGEREWEAELYRLKGQLTLQKFQVSGSKFQVQESPKSEVRSPESKEDSLGSSVQSLGSSVQKEAEECFLKAIEIARKQQAKSLELRAVTSLARLWQQQATQYASRNAQHEARNMLDAARNTLSEIYDWFTEGFDTKDLQEAKALLEELNH